MARNPVQKGMHEPSAFAGARLPMHAAAWVKNRDLTGFCRFCVEAVNGDRASL
jgi:hypothetical protein